MTPKLSKSCAEILTRSQLLLDVRVGAHIPDSVPITVDQRKEIDTYFRSIQGSVQACAGAALEHFLETADVKLAPGHPNHQA